MPGRTAEELRSLRRRFGLGEFAGRTPPKVVGSTRLKASRERPANAPRSRRRVKRLAVGIRSGLIVDLDRSQLESSRDETSDRSDQAVKAIELRGNTMTMAYWTLP